jgi:hypothetical protein
VREYNQKENEPDKTVEPFNSAIEHYQTIMGMPNKRISNYRLYFNALRIYF